MSVPESVPDNFASELSQIGGLRAVIVAKPIGIFRQRRIILVSTFKNTRMVPSLKSVDQMLSSSAASAVGVRRLLEENARLRNLLLAHGMPIPGAVKPTVHHTQTSTSCA